MNQDLQIYRDLAKSLLETNIYYHSLALEACMGAIYDFIYKNDVKGRDVACYVSTLDSDEPARSDWLLAGIIHDIDYFGQYKADHLNKTEEVLKIHNLQVSDSVLNIVKAHGPHITGRLPQNKAEWAIYCADSLTGLIVAVALVYPTKKLADVKLSSVLKRFHKEPRFAAGTRRQEVCACQDKQALNIPVDKFIEICLKAMQSIAPNIGL